MIIISRFDRCNITPAVFQELFSVHRPKIISYTDIYTDDFKRGGIVNCGVFYENTLLSHSLNSFTSVFTAELIAIRRAMFYISHHRNTSFIMYTDSNSSIDVNKSFNKHHLSHSF